MRTRRYNLIQRILIKANAIIYTIAGKLIDALTRIRLWGEFKYEVKGHYGDVIHVEHQYPKNFQSEHAALFDEWKRYDTFPHDLFYAKDCWLTADGIVYRGRHTFIKTLPHPIFRFQYGILYNLKTRLFYRNQKTDQAKKYMLLYDNWSWNNYFHWIIDGLCRAQLIEENVKEQFTIILPAASPKYITETLKLFGYTDFVYVGENSRVRITDLYSMNYAAWSGQQHPEILFRMVKTMREKTGVVAIKPFRKIYVSRGKQFSRRVMNEAEVIAILEQYDFETVYFEGMTFENQVKLMTETSHFVTSHGANMTNLIFLQKGAWILELINERKPNFCYWSVADCLGHEYRYQLCPIETVDHIKVDVAELERNLLTSSVAKIPEL